MKEAGLVSTRRMRLDEKYMGASHSHDHFSHPPAVSPSSVRCACTSANGSQDLAFGSSHSAIWNLIMRMKFSPGNSRFCSLQPVFFCWSWHLFLSVPIKT